MEDGFSSYSSLYDTSSLLQFCNGERGRADEGTGSEQRGPGRAAGEAAPSRPGSRRCIVLGPRGRASTRLPTPGLPDAHPRGSRSGRIRGSQSPSGCSGRKARALELGSREGPATSAFRDVLLFRFQTHICLDSAGCRTQQTNKSLLEQNPFRMYAGLAADGPPESFEGHLDGVITVFKVL